MAANINSVTITGNLTRDPELRSTGGGTSVCSLRVAVNESRKDQNGEWGERANYFDVTVWGKQGESCAQYLAKGRPIAVEGRLEWQEWEAKDGSGKRQKVQIVANRVQFLGGKPDGQGGGGQSQQQQQQSQGGATDTSDFESGGGGSGSDDDIPF